MSSTHHDCHRGESMQRTLFQRNIRLTVEKVSLLRTAHLIVSMLLHGFQVPDNPVPAERLTQLQRV